MRDIEECQTSMLVRSEWQALAVHVSVVVPSKI
jgi:hypothetical protein